MDTSSPESCDRLRQAIDDEVHLLRESIRALNSCRNALAPISRLPHEILAAIFNCLFPLVSDRGANHLEWICVTHVCCRWREAALNHPYLWSHIDFTKLTPLGMAEILARAKMAPLHLKADVTGWSVPHFDAFDRQLKAHTSHTRHLSVSGYRQTVLQRLYLSHKCPLFEIPQAVIPINLLNCAAPSLIKLELVDCDISWKSPLLKRLQFLGIRGLHDEVRPKLEDWLDALNEMPQLETLILQYASPSAPPAISLISEPSRAVTLPSLAVFDISAPAKDCALAPAHLILPTLTWLTVDTDSLDPDGEDVRLVIPYVARSVCEMRGTEPLRSILISCQAKVAAWTMPNADLEVCDTNRLAGASVSARLFFVATDVSADWDWHNGVDTAILDALLTLLPVYSVSSLTVQSHIRLSKEFWLNRAPKWPLLERVRLVPSALRAFREMLGEDAPPDGPRLPSLKTLILVDVNLTAVRTNDLRDMLIERVEQGVPLEVLDLRSCVVADCSTQLLREIVVDVQEPLTAQPMTLRKPAPFNFHEGIGYCNKVEYEDR